MVHCFETCDISMIQRELNDDLCVLLALAAYSGMQALYCKQLSAQGLTLVNVQGDGNCLFRAVRYGARSLPQCVTACCAWAVVASTAVDLLLLHLWFSLSLTTQCGHLR